MKFLQFRGQCGRTSRAIGLATDQLRTLPAGMPSDEEPDEFGDRVGILLETVELTVIDAFGGSRIAGGDGIDEDEVRDIEKTGIVWDDLPGCGQERADVTHEDPAGPERTQMEPDARRTGASVEEEQDRARRGIRKHPLLTFPLHLQIGDMEDLRLDGAITLVEERQGPGKRPIVQRLASDLDLMQGGDRFRMQDHAGTGFMLPPTSCLTIISG